MHIGRSAKPAVDMHAVDMETPIVLSHQYTSDLKAREMIEVLLWCRLQAQVPADQAGQAGVCLDGEAVAGGVQEGPRQVRMTSASSLPGSTGIEQQRDAQIASQDSEREFWLHKIASLVLARN